jgi:hypothetical protein
MLRYGVDNFIAQDSEYNMDQHDSQVEGGDIRIDPFVFLCYDGLGYIIYGLSNIGELICSEVYDYNNYIGLQNKILIYSNNILLDKTLLNINNTKYIDNDILNLKNKNNINLNRIDIGKLSGIIFDINIRKYDFNYYIFSNSDCCYSNFDLKQK